MSEGEGGGDLVSRDPVAIESRSRVRRLLGLLFLLVDPQLLENVLDWLGDLLVLNERFVSALELLEVRAVVGRAVEVGLRELGEPFVAALNNSVSISSCGRVNRGYLPWA